jgi:hypothetical protein
MDDALGIAITFSLETHQLDATSVSVLPIRAAPFLSVERRSLFDVVGLYPRPEGCRRLRLTCDARYQFQIKEIVYPGLAREMPGEENPLNSWAASVST